MFSNLHFVGLSKERPILDHHAKAHILKSGGFHVKSWVIAPSLHPPNWIVLVETFAFIRFWVDFTWTPLDFMRISWNPADFERPLARNCNPMFWKYSSSIERQNIFSFNLNKRPYLKLLGTPYLERTWNMKHRLPLSTSKLLQLLKGVKKLRAISHVNFLSETVETIKNFACFCTIFKNSFIAQEGS